MSGLGARGLRAFQQISQRTFSTAACRRVANKVPEKQKIFQTKMQVKYSTPTNNFSMVSDSFRRGDATSLPTQLQAFRCPMFTESEHHGKICTLLILAIS
ncbi:hypothetical protein scyTo_0023756 [Scyliorhinus torazame]|uniref:Uncharacterized protein n=1 Tax=Scyliorhinus torazame TaxID=75743 RepID=A0A401QD89_SCYTO|nr:hypothetical protein [Scyliorhinus torazame]